MTNAERYHNSIMGLHEIDETKNQSRGLVTKPWEDPYSNHHAVAGSMELDGYYTNHTREECKKEFARRYDEMFPR